MLPFLSPGLPCVYFLVRRASSPKSSSFSHDWVFVFFLGWGASLPEPLWLSRGLPYAFCLSASSAAWIPVLIALHVWCSKNKKYTIMCLKSVLIWCHIQYRFWWVFVSMTEISLKDITEITCHFWVRLAQDRDKSRTRREAYAQQVSSGRFRAENDDDDEESFFRHLPDVSSVQFMSLTIIRQKLYIYNTTATKIPPNGRSARRHVADNVGSPLCSEKRG